MWGIELARNSEISLSGQIYRQLKEMMLSGRLKGGERLPSTRDMARELAVSRNTVMQSYDLLMAEGYIESRPGAATTVAQGLVIGLPPAEAGGPLKGENRRPKLINFKTGQPDLRSFPKYLWNKITTRILTDLPPEELGYGRPEGHYILRNEIASWLYRSRGLTAAPENIFISAGATHALYLLADILNKTGCDFAVESPSHPGFRAVLDFRNYAAREIPVDENGLMVSALEPKGLSAVYVTPSHQFPLGGILDAGRRAGLIRLARHHDFFIIEDDYDSEFRYHGPPISPLYSMDPARVIYVGTFSKTMYPALRIGFVILPPHLQKQWATRRRYLDVQNPVLEQLALAEFMRLRKIDRHVRKMRSVYAGKRKLALECIDAFFKGKARPLGNAAGLHLVLELPEANFDDAFVLKCRAAGINVLPLEQYCPGSGGHQDKLLIGYGHLTVDEIKSGLKILAAQCKKL